MARTLDEVLEAAMQLDDHDRVVVGEALLASVRLPMDAAWRQVWGEEAKRRHERLVSGEDAGLTLDEFFSDDAS